MSKRIKINGSRLIHLRTSTRQLHILQALATAVTHDANQDFMETAAKHEIRIMREYSRSKVPFDFTARTGPDRIRVYVQTANLPARRHEHSSRGSSLLRSIGKGR